MAFFDEDEEKTQVDGPIATGAPSSVIGVGSSGGAGASPQQAQNLTPDKPGNFVGIQKYLEANKSQASKLGDQAAGIIGKNVNEAKSSLGSLTDKFKSSVGSAPTLNQSDLETLNKDPSLLNQNQISSLKSVYDASYKGPNSLTDFSDDYINTQKKFQNTKQLADASKTEPGRQTLIEQINNQPRSKGSTSFDSVLLSSGGGRQKIEDEASKARSFLNSNAIGEAEAQAGQYKDSVANAINAQKAQVQGAAKNQAKTLADQIAASLNKARGTASEKDARVRADIQGFNLRGEPLEKETYDALNSQFGADGSMYINEDFDTNMLDMSLPDFYKGPDLESINSQNVASSQDYIKNKALEQLIGSDISNIMGSNYLDQGNLSKAGTAITTPKFDSKKLIEESNKIRDDYSKRYNDPNFFPAEDIFPGGRNGPKVFRDMNFDFDLSNITGIDDLSKSSAKEIETIAIPKLENAAKDIPPEVVGYIDLDGNEQYGYVPPAVKQNMPGSLLYKPNTGQKANPYAGELAAKLKQKIEELKGTSRSKKINENNSNPKRNLK